jgi:hypothetical protein
MFAKFFRGILKILCKLIYSTISCGSPNEVVRKPGEPNGSAELAAGPDYVFSAVLSEFLHVIFNGNRE